MLTERTIDAIAEGQKSIAWEKERAALAEAIAIWRNDPHMLASKTTESGSKQLRVTPGGAYAVVRNNVCIFLGVDEAAAIRVYLNA